MKIYINGTLSSPQPTFHLTNLWFSNDDAEETDAPSLNCLGLSAPENAMFGCETTLSKDKCSFSSRWNSVFLVDVDEENLPYKTELFGIDTLILMLDRGHMKLRNASAFIDSDVNVTITSIKVVEGKKEYHILNSYLGDAIEFIV